MNKRNLQRELETVIMEAEASGRRPKLLLHVCCAPCSSYCLEYLCRYFDITVLYANSNIDAPEEYDKRLAEAERLTGEMGPDGSIGFVRGEYRPGVFHELVKGHENDPEGGERCGICFAMRMNEAARYASSHGYDFFTTSLSISPLKDALRLCAIAEEEGKKYNIRYLPSDFKKKGGYARSIELSREHGLYRQNYCGCSYSKRKNGGMIQ